MFETIKLAIIVGFLSLPGSDRSIPSSEIKCVADAVYYEARGEPVHGQIRVAQVIKNRIDIKTYTACEVVYQPHQFAGIKAKRRAPIDKAQYETAVSIAYQVLTSSIIDDTGVLWFDNVKPQKARPWFKQAMRRGYITPVETIGNHTFYRQK